MSEVKDAKNRLKKTKKTLKRAEISYFKANKHGSENQINLCKTRLTRAQNKFDDAAQKLETAKLAHPNFINKTITYVKESPIKKVFSWTGLAVTAVVTTIAGVVIYDYLNDDDENTEATDTV